MSPKRTSFHGVCSASLFSVALLLLANCLNSGCSGAKPEVTSEESAGEARNQGATTVTVAEAPLSVSPARIDPAGETVDLGPSQVCEKFLQLLIDGNLTEAEGLLSRQSIRVTREKKLVLSPPGGQSCRFHCEEPQFSTTKQKLAMVNCLISDEVSGEDSPLAWMVKKEDEVWRIFGLVVVDEENAMDMLSFENPLDVDQIQELIGAEPETREARVESEIETR